MSKRGPVALSIVQQALAIRGKWPGLPPRVHKNMLRWEGRLQPTAVSPTYTIRLVYEMWDSPKVHVLDPALDPGHRERLPHVYSGDRLCLYTPGEWRSSMLLSTTVIPWAAEWLFHYELWKGCEHWSGGGEVFAPDDERPAPSSLQVVPSRGRA